MGHIEKNCFSVPHLPTIYLLFLIFNGLQGIYRIIISLYPTYRKKGDLAGHFFCICPILGKIFMVWESWWGTGKFFFRIDPDRINHLPENNKLLM